MSVYKLFMGVRALKLFNDLLEEVVESREARALEVSSEEAAEILQCRRAEIGDLYLTNEEEEELASTSGAVIARGMERARVVKKKRWRRAWGK